MVHMNSGIAALSGSEGRVACAGAHALPGANSGQQLAGTSVHLQLDVHLCGCEGGLQSAFHILAHLGCLVRCAEPSEKAISSTAI